MTLRVGELVLGRFEITEALPPAGELLRYRARDTATGQDVQVHMPAPQAQIRPGARERFRAAHHSLPPHPALSPALASGEHQGKPAAAHPSALPFPDTVRRSPEEVAALAAWLLPAVRLAEPALGGELRPHDLVIDAEGVVRLQPAGLIAHRSGAVPDRFAPTDPDQGALYGLGVILFSIATGEAPFSARTPSDLRRQQQHPPRARDLRPELPPALDDLIAGLLSPLPAERRAAADRIPPARTPPRLQTAVAPPTPIAVSARSSAPSGGGKTPSSVPLSARRDMALSSWVVVADVASAPQAMLRRLAALLSLPERTLQEAARQGLPLPIAGGDTEAAARAEAERLSPAGVSLSVTHAMRRSGGWMLLGGGALGVALLTALLAVGGVLLGGLPLMILLLLGALATLATLVGVGALFGAGLRSGVPAHLAAGHKLLHSPPTMAAADASLPQEAELIAARRALLLSELPEPARIDLLTALDDLQDALPAVDSPEELRRVQQAIADITTAAREARSTADGDSAAQIATDASQKARAAQIAARELRR